MRILFLCNGNAARSQIAAAYLRKVKPDFCVFSAGVTPSDEICWKNRAVAWEIGLDLEDQTKHWSTFDGDKFDYVIAFSRESYEQTPFKAIFVPIDDPMPWGERDAFIAMRESIIAWIDYFFTEDGLNDE